MHEMSLAEEVLQLVEDSAQSNGFVRVKTLWLEIGALACVEVEALRFCFEAVVKGSLLEGAQLVIAETEGQGWCRGCAQTVALKQRYEACPQCGAYQVDATGGLELRVTELEVE